MASAVNLDSDPSYREQHIAEERPNTAFRNRVALTEYTVERLAPPLTVVETLPKQVDLEAQRREEGANSRLAGCWSVQALQSLLLVQVAQKLYSFSPPTKFARQRCKTLLRQIWVCGECIDIPRLLVCSVALLTKLLAELLLAGLARAYFVRIFDSFSHWAAPVEQARPSPACAE